MDKDRWPEDAPDVAVILVETLIAAVLHQLAHQPGTGDAPAGKEDSGTGEDIEDAQYDDDLGNNCRLK